MKIKKTYQGVIPNNKIVNTSSTSKTDTYSCDYTNKLHSYSTEEQVIGKWLGKPLYRKVLTGISTTIDSEIQVEHGINDYESIFIGGESHYLVNNLRNKVVPANYPSISTTDHQLKVCRTRVEDNYIGIYGGSHMVGNSFTYNIVIYYTKTTDTGEV